MRPRFAERIVTTIALVCSTVAILSFTAAYLCYPGVTWIQLVPVLEIPALAITLLTILISGLYRWNARPAVLSFSLQLLVAYLHHSPGQKSSTKCAQPSYTLLSWNAGQFENDTTHVNDFIEEVQRLKPDIILLQEFGLYYKWPDVESVKNDFARRCAMPYSDFSPTHGNIFGTAVFSKHPILAIDTIFQRLSHTNEAKVYHFRVGNDTLVVVNVHAQSFNLFHDKGAPISIMDVVSIQQEEMKLILNAVRAYDADVIAGDFNVLPGTKAYSMLTESYTDVQRWSGHSFIPTHQIVPGRIDYIFISKDINPNFFEVLSHLPSDHSGLLVGLCRN